MMQLPIYLDYAATTPVAPEVAEAMCGCLTQDGIFANPASRSHIYGWQAEEQVELARRQVSELIHCDPREVVWTSGATESNNLALKGFFAQNVDSPVHLVTSLIEHKSILDTAEWLAAQGVEVTYVTPDSAGLTSAASILAAIKPHTRLVSIMHVNNETGVINPIADIAAVCKERGIIFHVDAAQSAGKLDIDCQALNVDMLSLSAHKFYGPKGMGALFVRRSLQVNIHAQISGGGQERGMRSGTLATHQIVGMGEAARLAKEGLQEESTRLSQLRDKLWDGVADLPGVSRNGLSTLVSPVHLNICFSGVDGETLLLSLRELAVSTGSACASASMSPSYVLKAMGLSDDDAHSSIRFSLGRYTLESDIDRAIAHIRTIYIQLQQAV